MSGNRRLVVASNRGPVTLVADEHGGTRAVRGGGGLVSGMSQAVVDGGLWVCAALSDRERSAARDAPAGHLAEAGVDTGGLDVRMLPIDADTFTDAYDGIANATLWFVNHLLYDNPVAPVFDADWRRRWAAYERYNQAFADAIGEEAAPGGIVMVQDYHLFPLPAMLRRSRPDLRIGHFTHTPWAPPEYFSILPGPAREAVLAGLLGADHLGFHQARWAEEFLRCCAGLLGARVNWAECSVDHDGRVTRVGVHGLGTDVAALRERAGRPDVAERLDQLRDTVGDRQVIGRVDRTELSKNIVRGLLAYQELLRTRPEWRGRVTHVVYAYPSRQSLPEYREYTDAVRRTGAQIVEEFGTDGWAPLLLEVANDYPGSLAALRASDVLLVNPIRDGMNLVAQEGAILSDRGAALVLSDQAGATDMLGSNALLVNPYDVSATAEALHTALSMPAEERRVRRDRMVEAAGALPPADWFAQQLTALTA